MKNLYDASKSNEAKAYRKREMHELHKSLPWILAPSFIGFSLSAIGFLKLFFYIGSKDDGYYIWALIPSFISLLFLLIMYFPSKYHVLFDVIIDSENLIVPSNNILAFARKEKILIPLKKISKIQFNDDAILIEYHSAINNKIEITGFWKSLIFKPDEFITVLKKNGITIDNKKG